MFACAWFSAGIAEADFCAQAGLVDLLSLADDLMYEVKREQKVTHAARSA